MEALLCSCTYTGMAGDLGHRRDPQPHPLAAQAGINAIPATAFMDVGVQSALHFDGDEVTEDTPDALLRPSLVWRHRWDSLTRAGPTA